MTKEATESSKSGPLIKVSIVQPNEVEGEGKSVQYVPIKLPKTQQDMLAALKMLGISKNDVAIFGITLINFLNNKAGWHTTKEAAFPHELLKNLYEHLRQQGASPADLAPFEEEIKRYEAVLKRLEKDGKAKVEVDEGVP